MRIIGCSLGIGVIAMLAGGNYLFRFMTNSPHADESGAVAVVICAMVLGGVTTCCVAKGLLLLGLNE